MALRTVANLCAASSLSHRRCPTSQLTCTDIEGPLFDAAPALTNLLGHSDGKIVESATLALVRILQSFSEFSGKSCTARYLLMSCSPLLAGKKSST